MKLSKGCFTCGEKYLWNYRIEGWMGFSGGLGLLEKRKWLSAQGFFSYFVHRLTWWLCHFHLKLNSSPVFVLTVKLSAGRIISPGCFIWVLFVTYDIVAVQERLLLATFIGWLLLQKKVTRGEHKSANGQRGDVNFPCGNYTPSPSYQLTAETC